MGTGRRESFRETQASVGPRGCEVWGPPRGFEGEREVRGKAGPGDRRWASLVQSRKLRLKGG